LWSDQHGVRLQRVGDPRGADRTTLDGDLARRSFTLTYERAGRPVAAVAVGRPGALGALRRRVQAAARPEGMDP
jgi:3-phenylpropionate/trans-cinnamate dioxygenase ferredoxin reductase subunit